MPSLTRTAVTYPLPQRPLISWGALFAGFAVTTALGWLLLLLGSAFGMTIADVTDLDAIDAGFGVMATVWFLVSWIVAYFIGGMFAARVSGATDKNTGMFHGVAVWSLGAISAGFLAATGLQSAVGAGTAVVSAGASTLSSINVGSINTDKLMIGQTGQMLEDVGTELKAELKSQASALASDAAGNGGVEDGKIEQAINDLDDRAVSRIGAAIFTGEMERAKTILASETELSENEITSIVKGVQQETKERVEEVRAAATQAAESAATYGQAVLWTVFVSAALALLAALIGGALGANCGETDAVTKVTERVVA